MRVLLVEDEPQVREGLSSFLASGGFAVVAAYGQGKEAVALLAGEQPIDLALIDLVLPDVDGKELLREVRRRRPEAIALALTSFDDDASIFGALRAGAQGYLLKTEAPARILQALRDVAGGGVALSPAVARRLMGAFLPTSEPAPPSLTPRERQLLELLHVGCTYEEAARTMEVGLGTVQSYVKSLYAKLGVCSKLEAVQVGLRYRLITP